jgi:hypothetical protein
MPLSGSSGIFAGSFSIQRISTLLVGNLAGADSSASSGLVDLVDCWHRDNDLPAVVARRREQTQIDLNSSTF